MTAFSSKWIYEKLAAVIRVPQTTFNLVISRSCFAEDGKENYKDSQRMCTAIVLLITFCLVILFRCHRLRGLLRPSAFTSLTLCGRNIKYLRFLVTTSAAATRTSLHEQSSLIGFRARALCILLIRLTEHF